MKIISTKFTCREIVKNVYKWLNHAVSAALHAYARHYYNIKGEKFLKNFKKPIDKPKVMCYNGIVTGKR